MRVLIAAGLTAVLACGLTADDKKGVAVEWGGLKSTTPAGWKEETPSSKLRQGQFRLAKAEGDKDDAEVAIFFFPGGGGIDANLKRQLAVFEPAKGKDKVESKEEKIKIGKNDGVYMDIKGNFLKKAFPMAKESTPQADYRQIYVIFEDKDDGVASLWLRGPAKTVEKHKKDFDEWVKNFK